MKDLKEKKRSWKLTNLKKMKSQGTKIYFNINTHLNVNHLTITHTFKEKRGNFSKAVKSRKTLLKWVHGQTRKILDFWKALTETHFMRYMSKPIRYLLDIDENRCQLTDFPAMFIDARDVIDQVNPNSTTEY